MPVARRDVLRLALASPQLLSAWAKSSDWSVLDRLPRSQAFGITKEGKPRNAASLYRVETQGGADLTFDISNQQILASLDRDGCMRRVCVNDGLVPLAESAVSGGVYNAKLHRRGGPWKLERRDASDTAVELIGSVIPEFSWRQKNLFIRQVSFAPMVAGDPTAAPRALFTILLLENQGPEPIEYKLEWASNAPMQLLVWGKPVVTLGPAQKQVIEFAVCLETEQALESRLRSRSPQEWFEETYRSLTQRYGSLEVAGQPFAGESVIRYGESCRQSLMDLPNGQFGGGFMGSDVDTRDSNWNKDTFYCTLGAGLSDPSVVARAIPYYFRWGLPAKPIARGLARFPDAGAITQSLSLAVAPLTLAATYYRWSGDREYFLRNDFWKQATARAEAVLATRRSEAFLFPSMFISNGDARGHYHTGSNVTAWYAFAGLARLAREVYGDESEARRWSAIAARVARAIEDHCVRQGVLGPQFVEGVYEDQTYVPGHDGEESDTTLMPFYGFREADCIELIRHARAGLSAQNPYYAAELDGIWWHNHGGFRPATAPAWGTGLAAAGSRRELQQRLDRFDQLSDLDGSVWWWPYRYGETDRAHVLRGNGATKCGWASAIYLLRFVENVLGARVDVPSKTLRFAPFVPYRQFRWRGARLGTALFDLEYAGSAEGQIARVVNRNPQPYRVQCVLTAQDGMPNGIQSKQGGQPVRYYGLPALEFEMVLKPGEVFEFRAS